MFFSSRVLTISLLPLWVGTAFSVEQPEHSIGPSLSRAALRAVIEKASLHPGDTLVMDEPLNRPDQHPFLVALSKDLLAIDPAHRPTLRLAPAILKGPRRFKESPQQLQQRLLPPPAPVRPSSGLPETQRHRLRRQPLPATPLPLPPAMTFFDRHSKASIKTLGERLRASPAVRPLLFAAGLSMGDPASASRLSAQLGHPVMALPDPLIKALALRTLPADVQVHSDHLEVTEWVP